MAPFSLTPVAKAGRAIQTQLERLGNSMQVVLSTYRVSAWQ
jgi:hypothetical protein